MLRAVEIRASLALRDGARCTPSWTGTVELSLDCFICERAGRTTRLERDAERSLCTADEAHGPHYAPARISAFDETTGGDAVSVRAVVDYWWAPFHDAERDVRAVPLARPPWVRLHYGVHCRDDQTTFVRSIQTNLVRPHDVHCPGCDAPVARDTEAPTLRLLT